MKGEVAWVAWLGLTIYILQVWMRWVKVENVCFVVVVAFVYVLCAVWELGAWLAVWVDLSPLTIVVWCMADGLGYFVYLFYAAL